MQTQNIPDWEYYLVNKVWVYGNIFMIIPFLISCICRFFKKGNFQKPLNSPCNYLWTDHICRLQLIFTWLFYVVETLVKYKYDGIDSVCEKTFFVHHIGALFILPPLIFNSYIPWWVGPIGWMHGILIALPHLFFLNYIYVVFLFIFQYGLYQTPYKNQKGYWLTRFSVNMIYVFCFGVLLGDCSNFLPLQPPGLAVLGAHT